MEMNYSMIKSKKGIYFTIISIIIISILIGYSGFDDNTRIKQKGNILSKRAINMNNLLIDIEKDIERMILISGYRTVLSLEKYVSDTEGFVGDFNTIFNTIFINGNYDGTNYTLMDDASLKDWESRIQEETDILNLEFNIIPNKVWAEHISPWDLKILVNATIILKDISISWNYTHVYENTILIADFEDPLYKVKSFDKVTNLLRQTPTLDFINDSNNDTTNMQIHLNESYYIESTKGPSFIMRFEGNLSPSPYGIESMVNLEDFKLQSLPLEDKSLIDYIYFDDASSTTDYCTFDDMQTWFRIDSDHLNDYELDKIDYVLCP